MSKPVLLLMSPFPANFIAALKQVGEVISIAEHPSGYLDADIVVTTPMGKISAEFIANLPDKVGLIASVGVGLDHIDVEAAHTHNIQVSNTPVVTEDTADLTMALLLSTCRQLFVNQQLLLQDKWQSSTLSHRVHGKTLGIIGFGAIGQAVAKRAAGFGMDICYTGPRQKPEAQALNARFVESVDELLQQADIVSLHCALSEQTKHIINQHNLAKMKPSAVLINTGRGELVDEQALISALENGTIAAAGLDVFEHEPTVPEALKALSNVTLLPHIGSATTECRMEMAHCVISNIVQYVKTGKATNLC
ncbi:2-hydroxyacid dehydrogenase [Shewanella gaetbuli]